MQVRKSLFIGLGVLSFLALAVGLVFASDDLPVQEPESSPFFEATLQQAVDELDGKVQAPIGRRVAQAAPNQDYTTDPKIWPECQSGFTWDLKQWPWCHFTSDPQDPECETPWPTADFTWDTSFWWPECSITRDPGAAWCQPQWTMDPREGWQCEPDYTRNVDRWPWCQPRYTWDPAIWPNACAPGETVYTYDDRWPECGLEYTIDPYIWPVCHYTSDPQNTDCIEQPIPTQDYTTNEGLWPGCPLPDPTYTRDTEKWPWCDPEYTYEPGRWRECDPAGNTYTLDSETWPWCNQDPLYTTEPVKWPGCHYTSDLESWAECKESYPTKDYTWDPGIWQECDAHTTDPGKWPWCDPTVYTTDPAKWPWCNPAWTRDPGEWRECQPGYTNDPRIWEECSEGSYTQEPATWPACTYFTAEPRVWPECHYTSDPRAYPECEETPAWPTMDFTSDPAVWPECLEQEDGDLGDAPDSTNHAGVGMTAYPAKAAQFPTVFDPATGLPQGPKHKNPRADGWLGRWVTLENDADLLPDEDTLTNIDPPNNAPDRDVADDGVHFPFLLPFCQRTVFSYTVTITSGAPTTGRYVNVWFDWNRDGDWQDVPECPDGTIAPEWAVQNQLITLGPGTHVLQTPAFLPWNPSAPDIPEIWMRISIARTPAPTMPGSNLADGRGPPNGYRLGETEDYLFDATCPPPMADFVWDPTTICTDTVVSFFDTSTSPWPILTWSWDFGDSLGTSSLQNPTYSYGVAGTYDVSLTVYNGCAPDTITKTLVVTDCEEQDPDYDIWIKDNAADDGSVPSSSPWWSSPDIWVRNDGDCTNTSHQNPSPGTLTTVCVRTRNRLATTVDNITVNVYWASAGMGLSWPGSFSYISSFNIPSLGGGAQQVNSVPWNVPNIAGHFCLLARADAPDDPIGSGPDTVVPTDLVYNNNNIAQKNTNVVDYPEITACGFYSTTVHTDTVYFDVINPTAGAASVDIVFDSDDFPPGGTLIIEPGSLWNRWTTLTGFNQVGQTLVPFSFPATMGGINMMAHETAPMSMTIGAEIDERFTVSVEERKGGDSIGGIQYVRDMPNCIYLPIVLKNWPP